MTVFELMATSAWNVGTDTRIGLFCTAEKAEAKIREIKKDKEWKRSWTSFRVDEVNVK
jgi:tRNA A37 threonylcarbamoyladenosine synthetase subunit TsaC/SUA5/YrdC